MKVADYQVVFREFPDEITLALNISNCPNHCVGCHSEYLANDIGQTVDRGLLIKLITDNKGITCVGIMGGDADPGEVMEVAKMIKDISNEKNLHLKVGWYSGRSHWPDELFEESNLQNLDYIKIGAYREEYGPLDNPNTNQRMYSVYTNEFGERDLEDITPLFW